MTWCTKLALVSGVALAVVACGASDKKVRTPHHMTATMQQVISDGAKKIGCEPSEHDEMLGFLIDCPDGRIVFGHDSGENMREEQEGEPYPIEVMCFDGMAEKCEATIDRILAAGKQ